MEKKRVGIIGAGAWGTGLGQALARGGNEVQLWALEDEVESSINKEHENKKFLPGFPLSQNVTCTTNIIEAATDKDFISM